MNNSTLMGRLIADPEIRYSQGETPQAIARFTLAVDRRFKREGSQTADFIPIKLFGKQAEFAEKYLHKGTKVCAVGRIETYSYTAQDGTKRYGFEVVCDQVEFAESKAANSGDHAAAAPQQQAKPAAQTGIQEDPDGFMTIPDSMDEVLPF